MVAQEGSARHHHHPVRAFPELPKGFALEQASAMFRALGDPARLRLLARLVDGEICVTELADLEQEKLTTVSARLKTLYTVRLVTRRRQAKHIFYAIADAHVLDLVRSAIDHAVERG
jgi:ArsR family transcriptional regulator, lead/cadmium/zinc/bismuth-responsive transcriptional repressor